MESEPDDTLRLTGGGAFTRGGVWSRVPWPFVALVVNGEGVAIGWRWAVPEKMRQFAWDELVDVNLSPHKLSWFDDQRVLHAFDVNSEDTMDALRSILDEAGVTYSTARRTWTRPFTLN